MTGKKKNKKGRKAHAADQEPPLPTGVAGVSSESFPDAPVSKAGDGRLQQAENSAPEAAGAEDGRLPHAELKAPAVVSSSQTTAEAKTGQLPSLLSPPLVGAGIGDSEPFAQTGSSNGSNEAAKPSFVFSAGQNSTATQAAMDSKTLPAGSAPRANRSVRTGTRRRDMKCPPSERFGKLSTKSRQSSLQLAAHAVAFGQGRDPLSLVVSYEESGLRRIVKVPDGCSSDTIVDTSLRQAVAGTALESLGWQEALDRPKEDSYFTYSTVPEGLTVAKFRDFKGKILVTPLSTESGLLKLKEDAEKKRKAAEEALENVREYLQRLKSEDEDSSREKNSSCTHCGNLRSQLDDLLGLVQQSTSVDTKKPLDSASVSKAG